MPTTVRRPAALEYLSLGLALLSVHAAAIGLAHMLLATQRGVICGVAPAAHCWACYAAPALALAAVLTWRLGQRAPGTVHARR